MRELTKNEIEIVDGAGLFDSAMKGAAAGGLAGRKIGQFLGFKGKVAGTLIGMGAGALAGIGTHVIAEITDPNKDD